jgi:hypothetical protein
MPELHLLRIVPELLRFYIFVRICLGYRHLLPGGPRNTHSIFLPVGEVYGQISSGSVSLLLGRATVA